MATKGDRVHDAEAAMLGYLTGLSAAVCKAWIEAPVAKSAEALKAAFRPDCDDNCIVAARSEIEAYALARLQGSGAAQLEMHLVLSKDSAPQARPPNSNPWQSANYVRYGRG